MPNITSKPDSGGTREAPTQLRGMIRYLGPGMIIAAGVVGSGELIATTKVGAQAGISLLWIILLGCVIKVFTQIELGRYAVSTNETTLTAINRLPGPRLRANWIIWLWLIMMGTTYGMMGGIVGAVGQALAMTIPITGDYALAIESATAIDPQSTDVRIWATGVAIGTSILLFYGRYTLLQTLCVGLAFCFTLITIGNVIALQASDYAIPVSDILDGLWFGWPDDSTAWLTALAAFGIIGIGGTDLIVYPYWCLERGYGRFNGPRSDDPGWVRRALGWVRVMKVDALASMCIYTVATLAFYFIGAAVLHRQGSDPDGMRMVSTLASAYVPVFGEYAKALFLAGALAVLYSTFLVANAGAARLLTDCLGILGLLSDSVTSQDRSIASLSIALPLLALLIYLTGWNPARMIIIGGLVQSVVLPVIGFCALYFRFKLTDSRLRPGNLWDAALILSCLSLLVVGGFSLFQIFS
jgi:Mn2+/Fe2+ NRAMP family transporter